MWILIMLVSTVLGALENVYQKKSSVHFNVYLVVWSILVVSSILYVPILIHTGIPPTVGPLFWQAVIARVIIDSFSFVLFVKAIGQTHLSLAMPMTAFQPVFLLVVSLLINHLFPAPIGVLGVLIVVGGVYYLNFDRDTKHLLSPFHHIKNEKAVQLMLAAAFLWSIVTALERLGIDNSNFMFYTAFFQIFWAVCFTPLAIMADRQAFKRLLRWHSWKLLIPMGVLDAGQMLAQNAAISMTLPVYISAIGGTTILFASLFGHYFFGEKIGDKLAPTLVIIAGVALMAFS